MERKYRGFDNTMRHWRDHVAYLRQCAKLWESQGYCWTPDPMQAARVRAKARAIQAQHEASDATG